MPPKSARGKKDEPPPPMGPGSRLVSLPKFMKKFVFFNGVRLDPEQKKIEGKKLIFNFTTASFKVWFHWEFKLRRLGVTVGVALPNI